MQVHTLRIILRPPDVPSPRLVMDQHGSGKGEISSSSPADRDIYLWVISMPHVDMAAGMCPYQYVLNPAVIH